MNFTDVKDFKINDSFIENCEYLNKEIIEKFDNIELLDRILEDYKNHIVNKDLIAKYVDFEDLYQGISLGIAYAIENKDLYSLAEQIEISTVNKYIADMGMNINLNKSINILIRDILEKTIHELITYEPICNFLNMELAIKIYEQTHGNIAQFPFNYLATYINNNTYSENSLQEFVNVVSGKINTVSISN